MTNDDSKTTIFKLKMLAASFATILLAGCSALPSEENETADGLEIVRTEQLAPGPERYVATLAIEGMGCEMACGTKIAGVLSGLNGVVSTDIDFKGEGELSNAIVEFDAATLTEKQMIDAVSGLADGHYKVKSVSVVHYKPDANTKGSSEDKESLSLRSSLGYKLPNIFSVFRF